MVLGMPRMCIRDILLVITALTWATVTVLSAWRREPLDLQYWLIPAASTAALLRAFRYPPPKDDGEGGGE